jgi:hypothetical protein
MLRNFYGGFDKSKPSKTGALTIKNWWFNHQKLVGLTGKNAD